MAHGGCQSRHSRVVTNTTGGETCSTTGLVVGKVTEDLPDGRLRPSSRSTVRVVRGEKGTEGELGSVLVGQTT